MARNFLLSPSVGYKEDVRTNQEAYVPLLKSSTGKELLLPSHLDSFIALDDGFERERALELEREKRFELTFRMMDQAISQGVLLTRWASLQLPHRVP